MKIKTDNEFDQYRIDKALAENGKSVAIKYGELHLFAPLQDVLYSMQHIQSLNCKKGFIASVNKAIKKNFKAIAKQKASQKTAMETAQDIAIWYANEVLEGRADLEKDTI